MAFSSTVAFVRAGIILWYCVFEPGTFNAFMADLRWVRWHPLVMEMPYCFVDLSVLIDVLRVTGVLPPFGNTICLLEMVIKVPSRSPVG